MPVVYQASADPAKHARAVRPADVRARGLESPALNSISVKGVQLFALDARAWLLGAAGA